MTFALRLGCLVAALSLVLTGSLVPALRHGDGWLAPEGWFVIVLGLAVGVAGLACRGRLRAAGWFFALALVSQGAALQLIFAPPYGIYQYVRGPADIAGSWRMVCLVGVLAHGVYIGWASLRAWPGLWQTIRVTLGWPRLLLLVVFLLNAAILVSTDGLQYGFGVFVALWAAAAGALNLLLVVHALPSADLETIRRRVETALSGAASDRLVRRLPWGVALWVLVVSAFIAKEVYEGVPHLADSITYLVQAKYFSAGQLYLPPPPDAASFHLSHMVDDGDKWYGYGFPGWPAVLALGVLARVPWLVNPLLGAATVLLAHALVRRLYDDRLAHAVVLLLGLSPWFLFMSANFMPHTLGVALALAAFLAVECARQGRDLALGAGAGGALGLLFLTRPLEGILMSAAVGVRILGLGGPRPPLRMMITICIAGIVVGGLAFPYDQLLTGDPFYPPQLKNADTTWYKGADRLGFGPDIGNIGWSNHDPLAGHSAINAVLNANKNLYAANLELFGWSFGSMAFVALAFLFMRRQGNDLLFWSIILIIFAVMWCYWHPGGPDFGARYWYQLLVPFVVLTVRGAELLVGRMRRTGAAGLVGTRTAMLLALACLAAFVNFVPWRAVGKYHHYKERTDAIARLAREAGFETGALVFVRSLKDLPDNNDNDYPSAFILNPPAMSGPSTLYARYLGPAKMAELRAKFPGRPVWLIGRDAPGKPIRVIQRPRG